MGFNNINGPSSQPIIQSAQNLGKDGGGGGNTGYMNMRGKKKKKNENEEENSVFFEEGIDSFESSKNKKDDDTSDGRSGGKKFLTALSKFIKAHKKGKKEDSFEHTDNKEDKFQEYIEIEKESSRLTKTFQTKEEDDDEYEIIDDKDDGYYDGLDV